MNVPDPDWLTEQAEVGLRELGDDAEFAAAVGEIRELFGDPAFQQEVAALQFVMICNPAQLSDGVEALTTLTLFWAPLASSTLGEGMREIITMVITGKAIKAARRAETN
jgi:hypothetical protein